MWECAIGACHYSTVHIDDLLIHQVKTHERHQCAICGTIVPDGYFAIRHAFTEHSRAEYLRNYEADTNDIRARESIIDEIEAVADIEKIVEQVSGVQQQTPNDG